ncbi:DUF5123 domain-containing protein [Persicobacter diffluens]|uniref:DUF5123 domain-containing protein n=1 Tax=Persicobacter diffluens TaxID=981 RepID=A0AAN4W338_9BACT|nr:hypothetical protein PEDI_47890 [Persicobacter diffluens]
MKSFNKNIGALAVFFLAIVIGLSSCRQEEDFLRVRMFSPVLKSNLESINNEIVVNLMPFSDAVGYHIEVSRDSFSTVEYSYVSDSSYTVIGEETVGEELFWNTRYQIQVRAIADKEEYNSNVSDLGTIRTQTFPSNLINPSPFDVTDKAARVTWEQAGAAITGVKAFDPDDLRLEHPILEDEVSDSDSDNGEKIFSGLEPEKTYQIAIYSGETLRGWTNFTTKPADIDPNAPGVIDITDLDDPFALNAAFEMAADGDIILLKYGNFYHIPSADLNKSITVQAQLGFGEQKAIIETTDADSDWNIPDGVSIDFIRFKNVELRGLTSKHYVFNSNRSNTSIGEITFEDCRLHTFRSVARLRGAITVGAFSIKNSIVYNLPDDNAVARFEGGPVGTILFENSTFYQCRRVLRSSTSAERIDFTSCTFSEAPRHNDSSYIFDFGSNDVSGGVGITNCIFGRGWNNSSTEPEEYTSRGFSFGDNTNVSATNSFKTGDFVWSHDGEMLTPLTYSGSIEDLWEKPQEGDFNFKDKGFSGAFNCGDPRWRIEL